MLMTGESSTMNGFGATRQMAGRDADRQSAAVMQAVKERCPYKPALFLSEILGCDISTAERYFAGSRSPNFDNAVTMLRHPVTSVAMIEEATRSLSPEEHSAFWRAMGDAALRAFVRGNNE